MSTNNPLQTLKYVIILLLLLLPRVGQGQSIVGTSGLFHAPTAVLPNDGTLSMGASYIPYAYLPDGFLAVELENGAYDGLAGYGSLMFLPRLEVMFRYTGNVGKPEKIRNQSFMDRMISARLLLLTEGEYSPAVVFGAHDLIGKVLNEKSGSYFAAQYLVASKHLNIASLRLGLHAGYAANILDLPSRAYDGPFGGLNLMPLGDQRLELILEHDSYRPNAAARVLLFRHVGIMAGLWNFEELSVSGSVRVKL